MHESPRQKFKKVFQNFGRFNKQRRMIKLVAANIFEQPFHISPPLL